MGKHLPPVQALYGRPRSVCRAAVRQTARSLPKLPESHRTVMVHKPDISRNSPVSPDSAPLKCVVFGLLVMVWTRFMK